jgi:hypothetical protein
VKVRSELLSLYGSPSPSTVKKALFSKTLLPLWIFILTSKCGCLAQKIDSRFLPRLPWLEMIEKNKNKKYYQNTLLLYLSPPL